VIVVIDPGHGGNDPGAIGRDTKLREAEVNLAVAKMLTRKLDEGGHITLLTREADVQLVPGDRNRDLAARPEMANKVGADCFLSIHCNAAVSRAAHGFEIYTTRGRDRSDTFALHILEAWRDKIPEIKVRGSKEADFAVLRHSRVPAALVELAFLSHPGEERFLADPEKQERMAEALNLGLRAWARTAGI
jgi:N-acetylmuramoyl-L-alanine amidase